MDNSKFYVLIAIGFAVLLLLVVNLVASIFASRPQTSQPDYSRIERIVEEKVSTAIATMPLPVPGPIGPSGPLGPIGPKGNDGEDGFTPPCYFEPNQCRGRDGKDAEPLVCRQIEVFEGLYRFVGDDMWMPTPEDGKLPNACEKSDGSDSGAY